MLLLPRYSRLYKRRFAAALALPPLDEDDATALLALEDSLPLEAIAATRAAVHRAVRAAEAAAARQASPTKRGLRDRVRGCTPPPIPPQRDPRAVGSSAKSDSQRVRRTMSDMWPSRAPC
jgi:hypothetical protein